MGYNDFGTTIKKVGPQPARHIRLRLTDSLTKQVFEILHECKPDTDMLELKKDIKDKVTVLLNAMYKTPVKKDEE